MCYMMIALHTHNASYKRIVCKVREARSICTWWNDARVEGDHFLLIEEVTDVAVQHHTPNWLQRELIFWEDLGGIKRIKVILVFIFNLHCLDVQLPLRVLTCKAVVSVSHTPDSWRSSKQKFAA